MGYINELGERLAEMLTDLSEDERRAVIDFVKDEVWTSYKNGLRKGKEEQGKDDKRPAHHYQPKTSSH